MADATDLLEQQRQMMFDALTQAGGFYQNDPNAQAVLQQIMGQMQGKIAPYTPQVVGALMAGNADAGNQGFQAQARMIRQAMANAGLTGSGVEASALQNAMGQQQAAIRTGRQSIQSRADLENFAAQERAQAQAMSFLQQQQAAQAAAKFQEAAYRSQMNATGDAQNVLSVAPGPTDQPAAAQAPAQAAPAAPPRPVAFGYSNMSFVAPWKNPLSGGTQSYGGSMTLTPASDVTYQQQLATYNQNLMKQQQDRAALMQQQANWDAQYGYGRIG